MKISNKLNLPQPFVDAVSRDEFTPAPNAVRVTQLNKGTCEVILERRYGDQVERDVSDMIWLIFGTAVHSIIEQAEETDHQIKETRLSEPVSDSVVTGQFDLYDAKRGLVVDYKTCSVWKIIYNDYEDWRRQTLIYAWLLRKAGFPVRGAEIIAMMKDHSKTKAKNDASYPQEPVRVITFVYTSAVHDSIDAFVHDRIREIEAADELPDDELQPCTMEERWNDGGTYAVMKKGRKTALRVRNTEADAEEWREDYLDKNPKIKPDDITIEHRPGEDKKCHEYCSVNEFCPYYRAKYMNEE